MGLSFRHLIEILRPIRGKRYPHLRPRTGQCTFFSQINIQILTT
jgi:hypothetical protein